MQQDEENKLVLKIIVNGKPHAVDPGTSLFDLLGSLGIPLEGTAVELAGQIIQKDKYPETILADGQQMEIVRMVGGG